MLPAVKTSKYKALVYIRRHQKQRIGSLRFVINLRGFVSTIYYDVYYNNDVCRIIEFLLLMYQYQIYIEASFFIHNKCIKIDQFKIIDLS